MEPEESQIALDQLCQFILPFSTCSICYGYLAQATDTTCCHNLFCEECINRWLTSYTIGHCPMCRKSEFNSSLNFPIQRLVDQIPMTCSFKINGCKATPPRKDFEIHVQSCEFRHRQVVPMVIISRKDVYYHPIVSKNTLEQLCASSIDDSSKAEILLRLADCYRILGDLSKSRDTYQQAFQLVIGTYGRNHYLSVDYYMGRGLVEKKLGNYEQTLDNYTNATQIAKDLSGESNPILGILMANIADVQRKLGNFNPAQCL